MPVLTEERKGNGRIPPPPGGFGRGRGGDGDGDADQPYSSFPVSKYQIALWVLLTGIVMLFAGLTSAYIVLRGVPTWQNIEMPVLLWFNTIVLIASSLTIDLSRRAVSRNRIPVMQKWLIASGLLGLAFIAGQLVAWQQLVNAGVFLPSTLHSSFFYILTGIHGIHLLGGIVGLGYVLRLAIRNRLTVFNSEPLRLCATYWHFMDGLWVYLFLLLVLA
jgi:cytochrome c oxidase subunit 3